MQSKKKLFLATTLLVALFSSTFSYSTVYQPGMWFYHEPTKESIDENKFPSIAALEGVVPSQGVFMEYTDSTNAKDVPTGGTVGSGTNLYDNISKVWYRYEMFGYEGQFFVEKGKTYTFSKDHGRYMRIIIDGNQIMRSFFWGDHPKSTYTPTKTGYVNLEVRAGINGETYIGPLSKNFGTGYNTEGLTFNSNTWGEDPWKPFLDPGDCSILRIVKSETDYMTLDRVETSGDDVILYATFTNVPKEGTLTAFYGIGNSGEISSYWENSLALGKIEEGNTIQTAYTIPGAASANYVTLRLQRTDYASEPYTQFSSAMLIPKATPIFSLNYTYIGYSNITFNAVIDSVGDGAESVNAQVEIALDSNFTSIVDTIPLSNTTIGSEEIYSNILTSNTVHYARISGINNNGKQSYSAIVGPLLTLTPTAATGVITPVDHTLGALSAEVTISDFGLDSTDTKVCIEASKSESFTTIDGTSEELYQAVNETIKHTITGLAEGEAYYLRAKLVNSWGIVAYLLIKGPQTTKAEPFTASPIIWEKDSTGTLKVSINVISLEVPITSSLFIDGSAYNTTPITIDEAGFITWENVATQNYRANIKVVLTGLVNNQVYSKEFTADAISDTTSWNAGWQYNAEGKTLFWVDRMGFMNVISNVTKNTSDSTYKVDSDQSKNPLAVNLDFSVGFAEEGWSLPSEIPTSLGKGPRLTNIVFYAEARTIAHRAFSDSSTIQSISFNEGLLELGNSSKYDMFVNNTSLHTIGPFPSTLTNIGNNFCVGCTALTNDIVWPRKVTTVKTYAFQNTSINSFTAPEGIISLGEYEQESRMLSKNNKIKNIYLPRSLEYVAGRMVSDTDKTLGVNVWYKSFPKRGWHKTQWANASSGTVTNYFEWNYKKEYAKYGETNTVGHVFTLPETFNGTGEWKTGNTKEIIRWWIDRYPPTIILMK